jgi:hypothetical protein
MAEAVDAGRTGRRPLSAALAAYERRREEAAGQGYEKTVQRAALLPPPEMQPSPSSPDSQAKGRRRRVRMYRVAPRTQRHPGVPAGQEYGVFCCRGS